MSREVYLDQWSFNRERTLATLDSVGEDEALLTTPPAPGRAPVGWHLMHVAAVEDRFAITRLGVPEPAGGRPTAAYGRDSQPRADGLTVAAVRRALEESRSRLTSGLPRLDGFAETDVPDFLADRGWSVGHFLKLIGWHEVHHQGQAHAVLNIVRAAR